MAHDQQTYQRAATAAMIGLATQFLLAIAVTLVGLYTRDPATQIATWHLFGGLPIWLILWVLFHQHKLERQEALEAEQLAQTDARAAALFEDAGENLRVARRRLELIDKWWLPGVSLLVAVYLLAVGGLLGYRAWAAWERGALQATAVHERAAENAIIVAVVFVAVGFVGFLIARYIAGMTRVREWTLLRGGAAYLMGAVLLMALLGIGYGLIAFGTSPTLMAVLGIVVPILTALLGLEMLLGFVFGLYRPRRPGVIDRPAFDSRVLGLLTRPESIGKTINEAINYQFGFEISRSWFYRLLAKAITPLFVTGVLVLVGLTAVVIVAPEQEAVITRFGALQRVVGPGIHFKLPWPLGQVDRYPASRVQQLAVGSDAELTNNVAILWTTQHTEKKEEYMVTAPARFDREAEAGLANTAAVELVGTRVIVKYRVADLAAYVQAASDPEALLHAVASRRVNTYFVSHTIEELLTRGRTEAGEALQAQIRADLEALDRPLGIDVVFVGFEAIHPPQDSEVAAKFHEQIDARQEKATAIEEAERQAITTLAEVAGSRDRAMQIAEAISRLESTRQQVQQASAGGTRTPELQQRLTEQEIAVEQLMDDAGGQAAQMIAEARAYRWQRALTERGRALRLEAQVKAYQQAPEYYRKRVFLETMAEGLKDQRKTLLAGEAGTSNEIRLDLQDEGADVTNFIPND